jgi:hypothetical protein
LAHSVVAPAGGRAARGQRGTEAARPNPQGVSASPVQAAEGNRTRAVEQRSTIFYSGGTLAGRPARAQAVLMSVWRTCWQQGRSALDFLSQLLRDRPMALALPP